MLTVKDLSVVYRDSYREIAIVENISFTLAPGESLGIVGESGSGKTITALSLLRLLPPGMRIGGGQILLDTTVTSGSGNPETETDLPAENWKPVDLAVFSEKQMQAVRGKEISMIFQEPMTSLNPSMRCGEQVREAVLRHRGGSAYESRRIVNSLLAEVQLPAENDFYRKYPHQLSGGQRQRIMISMALAGNPGILIADEPTTALDVTVQSRILELLKEIRQKRKMGLLFISHDLGVIRKVCEKVLVIYRGKAVETGEVGGIFNRPGHPYTRGLIACRPVPGKAPYRLPTLAEFIGPEDRPAERVPGKPGTQPEGLHRAGDKSEKVHARKEMPGEPEKISTPEGLSVPLLEVKNLRVDYTLKKNLLG